MWCVCVCKTRRQHKGLLYLISNPCPSVPNELNSHISWSVHTKPPPPPSLVVSPTPQSTPPGRALHLFAFQPAGSVYSALHVYNANIRPGATTNVLCYSVTGILFFKEYFSLWCDCFYSIIISVYWFNINYIYIYYCKLLHYSGCGYIWLINVNICKHVATYFVFLALRAQRIVQFILRNFYCCQMCLYFGSVLHCLVTYRIETVRVRTYVFKNSKFNQNIIPYLHYFYHKIKSSFHTR